MGWPCIYSLKITILGKLFAGAGIKQILGNTSDLKLFFKIPEAFPAAAVSAFRYRVSAPG